MSEAIRATDALDSDKISSHLGTRRIGKKVIIYKSTASTNDIAAQYAKDKGNDGLVVLAEEQLKGRGRGGNRWFSSYGEGVICSILLTECRAGAELLSLACAVATAEAIGRLSKCEARIKWPNDIILNGKKTAGILVETKKVKSEAAYIIGIGINCHQKKRSFPAELRTIATSIDIETGTFTDRISLTKRLFTSVEHWLDIATKNGQKVIEQWQKLSTQLHHRVALVYNKKRFMGNCIGVDPEKGLILQLDTGGMRMFDAAHTTIAKE